MKAIAHTYLRQSIMLVAALFLVSLLYINLSYGTLMMVRPLTVCVLFQLVACMAYGVAWKKIAGSSEESLPMLYLSATGLRIFAALVVVLSYCFLVGDKAEIRFFVVAFLLYYFIVLIYDTCFFVKAERKKQALGK